MLFFSSLFICIIFSSHRSRKRRTSFSQDSDLFMSSFRDDDQMDECNAALVLMSLSGSPHSPRQWMLGSSPGSSSASWTSGSDELSDEGTPATGHTSNQHSPNRLRTASLSTSDEGIVMDYNDETPRKRRVSTVFSVFFFLILMRQIDIVRRGAWRSIRGLSIVRARGLCVR